MRSQLSRIYVEATGVLGLAGIVLSVWLATGTAGLPALLGAVPWLLAIAMIASGKVLPDRVVSRLPPHPWPVYAVAATATVVAAFVGWASFALAAAGLAALLGYTLWFSRQHRPAHTVTVGEPLPAFPLQTVDGHEVGSVALTHQPHVILFYRGSWCPFCVAQISAIAGQYRELSARGVRVALISSRRAEETEQLSARFDAPMDFYVDAGGEAAKVLDIVQHGGTPVTYAAGAGDAGGDTVVPTVIITREDGTVAWIHHADDHRVRPEPSVYLEVIDREGIAVTRHGA